MEELRLERLQDPEVRGKQVLKVSGGVTVNHACGLHEALTAALEGGSELQVDLSGVTDMDLSGLQLLCAAHQSALRGGKWMHITDGGNTTFRDKADRAGFHRHEGCARDISYSCIWVGGES